MAWILIIVGIVLIGIVIYSLVFPRRTGSNPEQRKQEVSGKYSPDMNRFEARKEVKASTARSELLTSTNQEQALIDANDEREAIADVTSVEREVKVTQLRGEQLETEMRNELMRLAQSQGMDITTYLQVTSHRELKQIDLEARSVEYQQDQEQISRVQQEKLELIDRASHRLYSFYEKRKELESSDDPAKEDKLKHLNHLINGAERLILGEQDRFIQATLGEEASRSLPAHDSGTSDTAESEAAEI